MIGQLDHPAVRQARISTAIYAAIASAGFFGSATPASMRFSWFVRTVALAAFASSCLLARAAELPDGFVFLSDIDSTIRQDMRYAGRNNFTGSVLPGYLAPECVLRRPAANALAKVQRDLVERGYTLKVFDCYRPLKAVKRFAEWAEDGGAVDPRYHPRLKRSQLIERGYIARRSGHSTGNAVDLTITTIQGDEVDMGTTFDFFDPKSHADAAGLSEVARRSRRMLADVLRKHGFSAYRREWWHFTFGSASAPSVDFDIERSSTVSKRPFPK